MVSGILYFFGGPEEIVSSIGIQNAYFLMFAFAFLGGLTTFNTVPYYSMLFLLATGGANPLILGISSATGVMCGDTFSYYLGKEGAQIIPIKITKYFLLIKDFAERKPNLFSLVCLFYGSFSPLSNDFLTIPSGMAKIKYWKVMLPLSVGNIFFNISLAYLCVYACDSITKFLGM